jgi:hypothetical protein
MIRRSLRGFGIRAGMCWGFIRNRREFGATGLKPCFYFCALYAALKRRSSTVLAGHFSRRKRIPPVSAVLARRNDKGLEALLSLV